MRKIFVKSMKYDSKEQKMVVVEALVLDEKEFPEWIKILGEGSYNLKLEIFDGY